jgi:DNA-binding winged helix-turn-helix (wHTH) protein
MVYSAIRMPTKGGGQEMPSLIERPVYRFGTFALDCAREMLRRADGTPVALRPKSFALLLLLVENAGRVVTRDTIMGALWPNLFVTDDNITQCVLDIRRALGSESCGLLKTVTRRGYAFEADTVRQDCGPFAPSICLPVPDGALNHRGFLRPPQMESARLAPLSVLILPIRCFDQSEATSALPRA